MKSNILFAIGILSAIIVFSIILSRMTGMLKMYRIQTPSMEPAVQTGELLFASCLKQPKRFDLLSYQSNAYVGNTKYPELDKEMEVISRLIGLPNEVIELKNDTIFINGKQILEPFETLLPYTTQDAEEQHTLQAYFTSKDQLDRVYRFIYFLSQSEIDNQFSSFSLQPVPDLDALHGEVYNYSSDIEKDWTLRDFGPYTIPPEHYFMISDNRKNCIDSRMEGPIHFKNIISVSLFQ